MSYSKYYKLCSESDIQRIQNPKDGYDHLLKMRVDNILQSSVLTDWYLRKRKYYESIGKHWNIECNYRSFYYELFRLGLSEVEQEKCKDIVCGFIDSNELNGQIFKDSVISPPYQSLWIIFVSFL